MRHFNSKRGSGRGPHKHARPHAPAKSAPRRGGDRRPSKGAPNPAFLEKLKELRAEVGRRADPSDPRSDTGLVMRVYGLARDFPKGVAAEARRARERQAEGLVEKGRLDLRKKFIFTCDPESARDFDDALSLERDRAGNLVLGVHIADVSHYVRPDSALDREAVKRSTSVYLCDRVVPMLPEYLSNDLCSLVPGEDRLAFSAFLTFDAQGRMTARRFTKSIIRSKARYTYEQVMTVLAGGKSKAITPPAAKTLRAVSELAQKIRRTRFAAGALTMEVPEVAVTLDAEGEMTGVVTRPYDESHQMVEECMVAANEAVAKELWTRGVKILARLHEPPDLEKLEELRVNLAGLGVSCGDISVGRNLAAFLEKIKGHPLEETIGTMVLRSMKRARYDSETIGHFGLAKKFYAHFTSPIRRYPDLVLHRQLASWISGQGGRLDKIYLAKTAASCSEKEQLADDAERALLELKKYRYLDADKSLVWEAVVSKCMPFGIFVDLPSLMTGGLVHVSRLSKHYVTYDEGRGVLRDGRRTWKPGDAMRVRVLNVDISRRMVDFEPVEDNR